MSDRHHILDTWKGNRPESDFRIRSPFIPIFLYFFDSLCSLLSTSIATAMTIRIKGDDCLTNQEPHHGPVHRVPSQPGLCHQRGVHCRLGNVSLEPADVATSMSQSLRMNSPEEKTLLV